MRIFDLQPCREIGSLKSSIKDAILDGIIPNEHDAALEHMLKKSKSMGLTPKTYKKLTIHYTKGEEWANTLSHGVGILIGIAGGGYLLLTAMKSGNPWATGGINGSTIRYAVFLYQLHLVSCQQTISSPRSVA